METVRNIMTCYCPAVKVKWLAYYSENGIQTLDTRHTEELRQKKSKKCLGKRDKRLSQDSEVTINIFGARQPNDLVMGGQTSDIGKENGSQ